MNTTKVRKIIIAIFTIIAINLAYFLCMIYPKKMIATSMNNLVGNLITDVIYSLVLCFLITFLFSSITNTKLAKKKFIFEFLFYVLVRCIFDLIYIGAASYMPDKLLIVGNVLTVFLYVILDLFNIKLFNIKLSSPRKHFSIVLISTVILIVFSVASGLKLEAILNEAKDKYILFSRNIASVERSVDFIYQLVNMCIDCFAFATVIIACSVSVKETNEEVIEKSKKGGRILVLDIVAIILIGAIFLTGAKYVIAPDMTLRNHDVYSRECKNYPERIIGITKQVVERRQSEGEEKTVFSIKFIEVFFDDDTVLKKTCGFEDEKDRFYVSPNGNTTVNLLNGGDVLFYSNGDIYIALSSDELPFAEYDELILNSCEFLLNNNIWFRFTEVIEYVMKYDEEFALTLLERYSKGDFTNEEISNECGIRTEYIQAISSFFLVFHNSKT